MQNISYRRGAEDARNAKKAYKSLRSRRPQRLCGEFLFWRAIRLTKLRYLLLLIMGCCSLQFSIREAGSCSVPVFRYALERWKPDPYKGIFIHRGEIAKSDQALLQQLEDAALNSEDPLNLRIRPVNIETFSEQKLKDILKGPVPARLPILAIWYPEQMGKTAPLWTIELTPAIVKALTGSPKRRELAESLINGQSVVWIFVPSGNPGRDNRAKALIRRELDFAVHALAKMPFFTTAGAREKKLTYAFPILTLSRASSEERLLLDMLMKSEPDLHEHKNEPMVFPVFGRGRVLGCLFGEYISEKKIQDAVAFLAASCSCEVKALNPGVDLLLPAQWDRVLMGDLYVDDDTSLPELTGVMPGKATKTEATSIPRENRKKSSILKISGITLSSVFVVVVCASLVLNYRRRKN